MPDNYLRVRRRRRRIQKSVPHLSGEDDFLAVVVMMMVDMLPNKSVL